MEWKTVLMQGIRGRQRWWLLILILALLLLAGLGIWLGREQTPEVPPPAPQQGATLAAYSPLHFRPAILQASDAQCLACHQSVLEERPRERSPAGLPAEARKAPYQEVSTYQGAQDSFHRRHLVTPLARELMDLRCISCHQGHDPRDETPGSSATGTPPEAPGFTLRRTVDTRAACLPCHGRFPAERMGLPGPWPEHRDEHGNSCLSCHREIRSVRHQVPHLKAAAIEAAGARDSEVCYGCHGGRAWYRISYPYRRTPWPGMPAEAPARAP